MKKNRAPWATFAALTGATLLSVLPASAAIDIADATTAITTAEGHLETLGKAAIGVAVLFMTIKLIRRGVAKV